MLEHKLIASTSFPGLQSVYSISMSGLKDMLKWESKGKALSESAVTKANKCLSDLITSTEYLECVAIEKEIAALHRTTEEDKLRQKEVRMEERKVERLSIMSKENVEGVTAGYRSDIKKMKGLIDGPLADVE